MQPRVSIVILNYNTRHFLEKFLPGVLATDYENFEVVLADNASKDDSVEFVKQNFPTVSIISLIENYGFAGGYNRALAKVNADYFVLLNSDVEVPENWLKPLVTLAESDSKIAAIQPKLLDYRDKTKFEYAGGSGGFIDKYGYPFCRGRWFNHLETDTRQYNDSKEIFWATGACFLIKSSCWKEMDGLDEDFFAHMEEIDLCWRLKNARYKIMVCPRSEVYHVGGGTLPVGNPRKTYLNFRNGLFLLCKNLHGSVLFKTLFIRFLLDGLAGIKFLTEFKFREIGAILKAHFTFYSKLGYWLNKRKMVPAQSKSLAGIYQKSMVFDFYLRGKRRFSEINW
ncbi:MAG: glycosyltransferase family 2 protein [Bacteroidia bacterium]